MKAYLGFTRLYPQMGILLSACYFNTEGVAEEL